MQIGLIRLHRNPSPPTSAWDRIVFVDVLRLGGFGVMLRASQRWPRYAGDHAGTQHRARTDTSAFRTAARFPTTPLGPWIGSRRGARESRIASYSYNTV